MMMMQRLNHRLRHVKLMNDSLCRILGGRACCFNGVRLTSGLTCPAELSPTKLEVKRASRSRTPVLAPRPVRRPWLIQLLRCEYVSRLGCGDVLDCLLIGARLLVEMSVLVRLHLRKAQNSVLTLPAVVVGLLPIVTAPWR